MIKQPRRQCNLPDEGEASGHARYRMSSISREMDGIKAKMKKEETEIEEAKVEKKLPEYKMATARDKRYGNPHGSHELGGGIRKDRRADHEAKRGLKKEDKYDRYKRMIRHKQDKYGKGGPVGADYDTSKDPHYQKQKAQKREKIQKIVNKSKVDEAIAPSPQEIQVHKKISMLQQKLAQLRKKTVNQAGKGAAAATSQEATQESTAYKYVSSINEKRDIPIILESINMSDDYEGSFDNRRAMITTLQFTAKIYLFGAVADNPDALIKRVNVDYFTDTNRVVAKREQRYSATPRAVKDYNDDNTTAINKPLAAEQTLVSVNSASNFTVDDYIRLGEENMQIRSISGNQLTVYRGVDGTTVSDHADGSVIDIISGSRDATLPLTGDDALIASGDDFGFNEMSSFYEDFKEYSPSQQKDV